MALTNWSRPEPIHLRAPSKAIELLLIKLPDAKSPAFLPRKPLPHRVHKLLASEVAEMIDRYCKGPPSSNSPVSTASTAKRSAGG